MENKEKFASIVRSHFGHLPNPFNMDIGGRAAGYAGDDITGFIGELEKHFPVYRVGAQIYVTHVDGKAYMFNHTNPLIYMARVF